MPHSLTDLAGLTASAEDLLAVVLETTAQPIWVADPDDVIRLANPAAVAALGYERAEELVGRRSHETVHHRLPDGTPQAPDEPMLDWFVRRDGSRFRVSYVSLPIAMPGGRGAVVAFTDIEDRARGDGVPRERDAALAAQQASLRRIATLVAGGAASREVFAAIAMEVAHVIGLPLVTVSRYEGDGTATVMGAWSERPHPFQAGTVWPMDGSTIAEVLKTGRPATLEDFAGADGAIAGAAREAGMLAAAGAPIIVDGDVWGVMAAASVDSEALPVDVEDRLMEFTELLGTAISSSASREDVARMAEEQAALRRVATLVARGVPPDELFRAATEEVGTLLGADLAAMARYETDQTLTAVATWAADGRHPDVGARFALEEGDLPTTVLSTGRPARMDGNDGPERHVVIRRQLGIRSSVAGPIIVDGRPWGGLVVHSKQAEPLPTETEPRLMRFAELVATAVSNAQARSDVQRLADEQAALRRVATLVARGVSPEEVFAAVAEEVGQLLGTGLAGMARYDTEDTVTVVATWAAGGDSGGAHPLVPGPWPLEGGDLASTIARTGRPVRIDDYRGVPGRIAAFVRDELGVGASLASPIVVERRLWGALFVHAMQGHPRLPADAESRLTRFTELVGTAIANTEARGALAASRARIVAAADETRRRIERDLHDGTQQRLLSLMLELRSAGAADQPEVEALRAQLAQTAQGLDGVLEELREISRGIHPVILSTGGLAPALRTLARRSAILVELDLRGARRLPEPVEVAAYYVVSEALTNAAKHAHASVVNVDLDAHGSILRLAIRDDGVGGADPGRGSGLVGLSDRVEALGGMLEVTSPPRSGTTVLVEIPVERAGGAAPLGP